MTWNSRNVINKGMFEEFEHSESALKATAVGITPEKNV